MQLDPRSQGETCNDVCAAKQMHCVAAHSGDTCPQNAAALLAVRNETAEGPETGRPTR